MTAIAGAAADNPPCQASPGYQYGVSRIGKLAVVISWSPPRGSRWKLRDAYELLLDHCVVEATNESARSANGPLQHRAASRGRPASGGALVTT